MNDLETIINVCKGLIGSTLTVTDKQITETVDKVKLLFPDLNENQIKKHLLSLYNIVVDDFQVLEGKDRRQPWLNQFKSDNNPDWSFWRRYKEYLDTQKHFAPAAINQIDKLTETILDKLFNPNIHNVEIDKKGLVVGQVQSGKTANYTGLICKAADAGFNMIIVLAGIHNNLRSQTQLRLDEGFLGFDTQYERAYSANDTNKIGVGRIPGYPNAIANSITTSVEKGDFTRSAANSMGVNFNTPQPFLLVIKKNVSVLENLKKWLEAQRTNKEKINNKSLLIIDDEADNASINTAKEDEDPTSINRHIREIIRLFNKSAYVGYTATAFANIFIPLDDDDLFPRDFIINIPAPSNYIGPEKVFGTSLDPDSNEDVLPIVNTISDYENFVPTKHKKGDMKPSLADMPESLRTAIKCFIMTCAIRIARGQEHKHNSMLIHLSRFTDWQDAIKELVEQQFNYYKQEIEANDRSVLNEFKNIFEKDTSKYKSFATVTSEILQSETFKGITDGITVNTWDEIKPLLFKAVQKITVLSINGTSGDALRYYEHEKEGISVIAIGGDKLSRGLTLEGLSVSYFLRASKMYDTLMQMGRWFGYRPGYVDLCRLFTSSELNEWYQHITVANNELRAEFNYLADTGSTPDNYALKVRTHPGNLQITAAGKMRYTMNADISWSGRLIETYQLPINSESKQHNFDATERFISQLGPYSILKNEYYWSNVSPDIVCSFLNEFKVSEDLTKVNLDLISEYINKLVENDELKEWHIVLMNKQEGVKHTISSIDCGCFIRNRSENSSETTYYIRNARILGATDEFIDLDSKTMSEALNETKQISIEKGKTWDNKYPSRSLIRDKYRSPQHPLLIIYPLDASAANYGSVNYKSEDTPFIGFAIAFPHSDSSAANVSYTMNLVANFADTENIYNDAE